MSTVVSGYPFASLPFEITRSGRCRSLIPQTRNVTFERDTILETPSSDLSPLIVLYVSALLFRLFQDQGH
jgi:hypothetical protein